MKKDSLLIIVLSRNYSTALGVIRALGAAGYVIDLVASVKKKGSSKVISCSKYVHKSTEVLAPDIRCDKGDGIISVLMNYAKVDNRQKILFPTDDVTASIVDKNRTKLQEFFLLPHLKSEEISFSEVMDKNVQGIMARTAGLLVPQQQTICLNREYDEIIEKITYPCFVKPLNSVSGYKTEMKVCADSRELASHLDMLKKSYPDRSVLVQEYLSIDREYDISGVCTQTEVVIPAVIEKIKVSVYERGVAMCGKIIEPQVIGQTVDKIKEMMQDLGYIGMFDIDLNRCGEKIYFGELNLRSGGLNFACYLNGVNLPDIFIKDITGRNPVKAAEKTCNFGKTFVYEKVAWEDYIHGYIRYCDLKKCIRTADQTLLAFKEDPSPGRYFMIRIRLSLIKQRVLKLFRGKRQIR